MQRYKTKKKLVLVVGGAGYIGSHMVVYLQSLGYTPLVLDNLVTGHSTSIINTNLIVGDFADKALLDDIFSKSNIEAVMHFASFTSVSESIINPAKYYKNNVVATLNLLETMIKYDVKKFIFSSTAATYGAVNLNKRLTESDCISPINPYGRSKWMVEEIVKDFAQSYNLNYIIFRYFNAAGSHPKYYICEQHNPETHLIPLILQVAMDLLDKIVVYGNTYPTPDGTCVRDYIHVMDLCHGHLLGLEALDRGLKNKIYNLGSGYGHSVLQTIKMASKITKRKINYQIGEPRIGDSAFLVANSDLAKNELGWVPQYSDLETIIKHAWTAINLI